jgi:hypothetical protein
MTQEEQQKLMWEEAILSELNTYSRHEEVEG